MLLTELLAQLYLESEISHATKLQYSLAISRFSEYLGRPSQTSDLTPANVNGFLLWLGQAPLSLSATSVINHRAGIIRAWNYASNVLDIIPACPTKRIRRPKRPQKRVVAWTLDELDILLQAAESIPGALRCGIPANTFLLAYLWFGYEAGYRRGDLRRLTWDAIDFERRTASVSQNKTGSIHTVFFSETTERYLRDLQVHGQTRVFPLNQWGVRRWYSLLFSRAEKLGWRPAKGQGLGVLRKTHATEIYRQYGLAAAAESIGHRGGITTVRNHYVDARASSGHVPPSPRKRA